MHNTSHQLFPLPRISRARRHRSIIGKAWELAPFAVDFPELSALTLEVSYLSFDKSRVFLQRQAKRAEKDVSLFSLSVPAVVIARWGGLVVILTQLYFLLHLRGLRQRVQNGPPSAMTPWIGIYPDVLAKAATMISAFLMPPVLLGAVIMRGGVSVPLLGVVALSTILGGMSLWIMQDLWRQISSGPHTSS